MRGRSSREKNIVVMAMVAVLCLVGPAVQAALVTLDLRDYGDGTYDLYAEASTGDNFGIVYYNIDLVNILTAVHQSPTGYDLAISAVVGFAGARSNLTGDGALFAYQDTLVGSAPASLIYGIGQTAGTRALLGETGVPWTAPVLLASGTYDVGGPAPWRGQELVVNILTQEWTDGPIPQGLVRAAEVIWIPEPATMAILALGAIAFLARRR